MNTDELKLDHTPLSGGKYKGLTPDQISEFDPDYIVWLYRHSNPPGCSNWLYVTCLDSRYELGNDEEREL